MRALRYTSDVNDDADTEILAHGLETLPGTARRRAYVEYVSEGRKTRVAVDEDRVIGSSPDADITVSDRTVSRLHCELLPRDDGVWVHDLGSRNGTYIDGVQIREACLKPRQVLRVGETDIVFDHESEATPVDLWPLDRFDAMYGRSVLMREAFARMHRYAQSTAPVLLQGETGTGKELAAAAIHRMSERHDTPMVIVDCGSIPDTLIESELFGHVRGAFTGAVGDREGAIEAAHGGTLFLDEVGELPLAMQPKLLRFLESGTVRRVGETRSRSVDVRVISATHRALRTMVNRGTFREDLYFRLAVLPTTIPALRERAEDIEGLVGQFVGEAKGPVLSPDQLRELSARSWDGNVRELRNFVHRLKALGAAEAFEMMPSETISLADHDFPDVPLDVPFKNLRENWNNHLEREYIGRLLEKHRHNVTAVAQAAGIDRTYVHRLMKKHGL